MITVELNELNRIYARMSRDADQEFVPPLPSNRVSVLRTVLGFGIGSSVTTVSLVALVLGKAPLQDVHWTFWAAIACAGLGLALASVIQFSSEASNAS
jgi:hypothetical protein